VAIAAVAIAANIGAVAPASAASRFSYTLDGDNATVTGCTATCPPRIAIPAKIGGHPVTAIGAGAFSDKSLTLVKFPNGLISIGGGAFYRNSLTSLKLPDSVTSIGAFAFSSNSLTSIRFSKSLTEIPSNSFAHNHLASLTISSSVTTIGDEAFAYNDLVSVKLPDSVSTISGAFQRNPITTATIPASVTSLNIAAFWLTNLTSVTFLGDAPTSFYGFSSENPNYSQLKIHVTPGTSGWLDSYAGVPVVIGKPANAPTRLSVKPKNGFATISFKSPTRTGGTPITGYEYTLDNGQSWAPVDSSSTDQLKVITGLPNGLQSTIKLRAVNSAGGGTPSRAVNVTPHS